MGNGFIAEDGVSFVSIRDTVDDIKPDKDDNLSPENMDLEKIPEEHRETFKKLLGELKEKGSALDSLKEKADLTNAIKELALSKSSEKNVDAKKEEDEDPFKDLKFEDGDYYRKFIEPLMSQVKALNKRIKDLGGEVVENKKTTWVDTVKTFIKSEGLSKEVVLKMDELAVSMGKGVYNDLPRLAKLAKMELGIKEKDTKSEQVDDVERKRKNVVNFNSKRKGADTQKPKVKNMADAWDVAEDQLAEAD